MARKRSRSKTMAIEGADELMLALRKVGSQASGLTLKKAAGAGAEVIRAEASRLAPRDSGDLADHMTVAHRDNTLKGGRAQVDVGPGSAEWYGRLQEFGSEKQAPQPFLRPALDSKRDEAVAAVRKVLLDALKPVLK